MGTSVIILDNRDESLILSTRTNKSSNFRKDMELKYILESKFRSSGVPWDDPVMQQSTE
jgi:hypothetical protein